MRTRVKGLVSSFLVVISVVTSCHRICWFVGDEVNLLHNPYLETETGIISVKWSLRGPQVLAGHAKIMPPRLRMAPTLDTWSLRLGRATFSFLDKSV